MNGSKVGVAVAIALGILLIYIALIGNASKLLALFGAPASGSTGSSGSSLSGTTGTTATTSSTAASASVPSYAPTGSANAVGTSGSSSVSDPLMAGVLSGLSLGGSTLGVGSQAAATNLLQSELGISNEVSNGYAGSQAGTTGGLSGLGIAYGSPTLATQPTNAGSSATSPAETTTITQGIVDANSDPGYPVAA